jgi:hypothetical protein
LVPRLFHDLINKALRLSSDKDLVLLWSRGYVLVDNLLNASDSLLELRVL